MKTVLDRVTPVLSGPPSGSVDGSAAASQQWRNQEPAQSAAIYEKRRGVD